ncbi:MAG: hypothetical protein KBE65_05035 [Phycisphaerae bacterium]|nr:hypothetical protein [Phycisphaerae bacterium]
MATMVQIQANRLNAQKSTGPRTAEGKETASRNAIKHGLLARDAVIQGEDPADFETYREGMLQELHPAGAVETMLAERVVGLSWRLQRAERLQHAAFAALDEGEPEPLLEARLEEWKQLKGNEWDRGIAGVVDKNATLGRLVVEDFAEARVLDRLLMYERRIESSLYRTMAELRRERQARTTAGPGEAPRLESGLPAGQEAVAGVELGSFGAQPSPEGTSDATRGVAGNDSDFTLQTSHFELQEKTTPYGVTTNDVSPAARSSAETLQPSRFPVDCAKRSQSRDQESQVGSAREPERQMGTPTPMPQVHATLPCDCPEDAGGGSFPAPTARV